MTFAETSLASVLLIEPEPIHDARGFFARLYCARTFAERGLNPDLAQISISHNRKAGIVRGLHIQRPPHAEAKLVRVTRGAIFDVALDVRAGSPTYGAWYGAELSADNRRMLYIPEGCAHGFQTLTDDAEVCYHISTGYAPAHGDGIRWNDRALAIAWPDPGAAVLSERDAGLPPLEAFAPVEC